MEEILDEFESLWWHHLYFISMEYSHVYPEKYLAARKNFVQKFFLLYEEQMSYTTREIFPSYIKYVEENIPVLT